MPEEKRVRRTPQQIAQDLDAQMEKLNASIAELEEKKAASAAVFDGKIAAVKEKIKKLEARKKDVLAPKKRKVRKTKAQQIKDLGAQGAEGRPQAGRDCKPSWHFDGRINTQAGWPKNGWGFPPCFFVAAKGQRNGCPFAPRLSGRQCFRRKDAPKPPTSTNA